MGRLATRPPATLAWTGRLCGIGFTRYNAEGVEGLLDRPRSGRKPRLNEDQLIQLDKIVEKQPDPVADGVVRWRCADLKEKIAKRFGVALSERSVGRILNERGFRKLSARPKHPEVNTAILADSLPGHAKGKPIEIWFQDEARVGQKGTLTRLWARKGNAPPRRARYALSMGLSVWRRLPGSWGGRCARHALRQHRSHEPHLEEIGKAIAPGAHAALILELF